MKQIVTGGGGRLRLPTEQEVEVAEILLTIPIISGKSEFLRRFSFTWGSKKKRSALVSRAESSPEKVTPLEAGESPSTPLCFLPSGSGSDGGDKRQLPSSVKKNFKRKAADDLVESHNKMQQEKEILVRETKAMKTLHQELTSANLELKAVIQKVSYSRCIIDHQSYYPQPTMFVPQIPQQQQHCQQLVVDPNNGKLVPVSCSGNSHGGGRFRLFNQIDPRVNIYGETYDFMASSQPLDQSKYLVMDNDLSVRTAAAAARKRRMLRMKENKNALLALKLSSRKSR